MDIIRKPTGFTYKINKSRKRIKSPKFIYLKKKTKKRITDMNTIKHINSLRIPPAYKNVSISSSKKNKVQAIGEDEKGRKQYIYSRMFIENQENIKFKDLILFGKEIENIRKDVNNLIKIASLNVDKLKKNKGEKLSKTNLDKDTIIGIVLYLIDNCNFRVGCEKYKKLYNTFGVTTLNKSHIKSDLGKMIIEFIGKKGVVNKSEVKSKEVCELIKILCNKTNNKNEYIFKYGDSKLHISERQVNLFLKKYNPKIKVKMFRTWNANIILLSQILSYPMPEDLKEAKENLQTIIENAAQQLHHSKNVSKSSYMNNKIIDLYQNDLESFKKIFKQVKKNNGGKLPSIPKILNELFIYLDNKNKKK